jgi:LacI family transcriptional regulator
MIAHKTQHNDRIEQRIEGTRDTLAQAGIAIRPHHFVQVDSRHIASGRDGMRQIHADGKLRPTALICTNDYIATGAMIEARVLNLVIPQDLSIVGFDDIDMSAHLDPPLTTIRIPSRKMGDEIATYIIRLLGDGKAEPPSPLDAELIIRSSTAPPPPSQP